MNNTIYNVDYRYYIYSIYVIICNFYKNMFFCYFSLRFDNNSYFLSQHKFSSISWTVTISILCMYVCLYEES